MKGQIACAELGTGLRLRERRPLMVARWPVMMQVDWKAEGSCPPAADAADEPRYGSNMHPPSPRGSWHPQSSLLSTRGPKMAAAMAAVLLEEQPAVQPKKLHQ